MAKTIEPVISREVFIDEERGGKAEIIRMDYGKKGCTTIKKISHAADSARQEKNRAEVLRVMAEIRSKHLTAT